MNRYKITFYNGQSLLLYKPSMNEINTSLYEHDFGGIQSITPYTDQSHEEYITKIKQQSEFIGYDRQYETYKCLYYKGYLIIQFVKDNSDNTYYDYTQYQEYKNNRIINPITKTMSTPEKVYKLILIQYPQYIIYSHRYYGEPKLSKPKELKRINPIGKAIYIPKHCEPQIFIKDKDVYIKHTDYFSYIWSPPEGERIDIPLSYYAEKYFNKNRKNKFVYPDCWGSIVLRNEAWILLKDIIPLMETENSILVSKNILQMQRYDNYSSIDTNNECEWLNFWENVCLSVKDYLEKNISWG